MISKTNSFPSEFAMYNTRFIIKDNIFLGTPMASYTGSAEF